MTPKELKETKMLGNCITDMLFYVSQLHYVHWLTLKNHHHVVVGTLYTELEEELDGLAEQFMGACLPDMRPEQVLVNTKNHTYSPIKSGPEILSLIDEITKRVDKGLKLAKASDKFAFLSDSLMDMAAILHSAKYQISQD